MNHRPPIPPAPTTHAFTTGRFHRCRHQRSDLDRPSVAVSWVGDFGLVWCGGGLRVKWFPVPTSTKAGRGRCDRCAAVPAPGGEHNPGDVAVMPWNVWEHRRKFLHSPGRYLSADGCCAQRPSPTGASGRRGPATFPPTGCRAQRPSPTEASGRRSPALSVGIGGLPQVCGGSFTTHSSAAPEPASLATEHRPLCLWRRVSVQQLPPVQPDAAAGDRPVEAGARLG
jgi:hypothetical protein